jgi:hypothetical protein
VTDQHTDRRLDKALTDLTAFGSGGKLAPAVRTARRIRDAVRRDRTAEHTHDGYPSGGGDGSGIRGTAELTSVEAAAEARAFGRPTTDPHHELTETAVAHILEAAAHLAAAGLALNAIDALADTHPAPGRTEAVCCETTCESVAVRHGRCEACYRWRYDWTIRNPNDTIPPVPAALIAAREERRTRTRVHVTGPMAETVDVRP